ncbi:MAG: hypothetical protein R3D80_17075 [Paracoccaceae bacterium]
MFVQPATASVAVPSGSLLETTLPHCWPELLAISPMQTICSSRRTSTMLPKTFGSLRMFRSLALTLKLSHSAVWASAAAAGRAAMKQRRGKEYGPLDLPSIRVLRVRRSC